MKKDKFPSKEQEQPNAQRDNAVRYSNQVPFRYIPVKDPFEKSRYSRSSKDKLYRVIKIK